MSCLRRNIGNQAQKYETNFQIREIRFLKNNIIDRPVYMENKYLSRSTEVYICPSTLV